MKIDFDRSSQTFCANSTKAAKEIFADGLSHMIKKDGKRDYYNAANMLLEDIYQHAPDIKIGGKYIDKGEGTAYLKMPIGNQDNLTKINTHSVESFIGVLKKYSYIINAFIENNKLSIYSGKLPANGESLAELPCEKVIDKIMKRTVKMD